MSTNAGIPNPVERLVLVDEMTRPASGPFVARSLPGHQIQFVLGGRVAQWAEGRYEKLETGVAVWYHESEPITGEILAAPWRFITLNFLAPRLPPPPDDQRVVRCPPAALARARELLKLWREPAPATPERHFQCHILLLSLLLELRPNTCLRAGSQSEIKIWWAIEKHLRSRIEETVSLKTLASLSRLSLRTLMRACKAATGLPPMKRIKELRLDHARGLVQHSTLSITDIAFRVGYSRSQEFSRDYHKKFGLSPRAHRLQPPDYQTFEPGKTSGLRL